MCVAFVAFHGFKPSVRTFTFGARLQLLLLLFEAVHLTVDSFVLLISTLSSCTISQTWNGKNDKAAIDVEDLH